MKDHRKDGGILTLGEYLRYCTKATELCVICDPWRIATAWIDHEDLFLGYMDRKLLNREVYRTEWETLEIVDEDEKRLEIPVHYIYLLNSAKDKLANGKDEEE